MPFFAVLLLTVIPGKVRGAKEIFTLAVTFVNLCIAIILFNREISYYASWVAIGNAGFSLRLYSFSAFILLSAATFGFLVTLFSCSSLFKKSYAKQFYIYTLLSIGFVNGAVLADNMVALLFFWEGLLITTYAMIAIGNVNAYKTAAKSFIIVGVCDLLMMGGIAITGYLAGTLTMSQINLPVTGLGALAFIFLMIGAISKSGSMPFHSWIPDAALDAPLPFMAILPGSLEKLLGIYLLTRISLDIFKLTTSSWLSPLLMIIGCTTIFLAVMMALIQKDYKKLLSYHAISQVGYMVLGIGTMVPAGIVGGLFHMLNNAMYKCCLFLTGGAVEKQAGTTNLEKLGGLGRNMPITFTCFLITAASISGVPPFNGFFSKELVYDGALSRGWMFYAAALVGSFFTAASFLKLGHAAFLGRVSSENRNVKEASILMLIPMLILAAGCVLFGVYNKLPLNWLIQPSIGEARLGGHSYAGFPGNYLLIALTVVFLLGALVNHIYGYKRYGCGLRAADHIHYAPVLSTIYDKAEKGYLDPYNIGLVLIRFFTLAASRADKAINWVYDTLIVNAAGLAVRAVRTLHNGSYRSYVVWSLAAFAIVAIFLLR
jgi:formate hydrogenlyase subunit 3/multisubunit Na+/H+ antiporter MnhD subunit